MAPTFFRPSVWFCAPPGPREFNSYRAKFFFKSCGILWRSRIIGRKLTPSIRTIIKFDFSAHNSMFLDIFGSQRQICIEMGWKPLCRVICGWENGWHCQFSDCFAKISCTDLKYVTCQNKFFKSRISLFWPQKWILQVKISQKTYIICYTFLLISFIHLQLLSKNVKNSQFLPLNLKYACKCAKNLVLG